MENRDLAQSVLEFGNRVRARPAEAVGPELDGLMERARQSIRGSFVAQTSPVADYTWLTRSTLVAANPFTDQEPIEIGYDAEIVGVLPTILLVTAAQAIVEPPMEAIDVFLQIDRKDTLTARADQTTTQLQNAQMVNLPAISATVGNRLFCRRINAKSTISVKFGWAVDVATVAAFGWGDVQISLNWYVLDLTEDGPLGSRK